MKYLSTLFLLCLFPLSLRADELRGKVVGIADGDTLTVLDASNAQHKIRLNGIDAPEIGQDFGQASKQNLSMLAFSKDVAVVWSKRDRYGRIVGTVIYGALDLSLIQLRDGFAWYFRQYEQDVPPVERLLYAAAEEAARTQRRGLWQQPGARPPWEVRHPEQAVAARPSPVEDVALRFRNLTQLEQAVAETPSQPVNPVTQGAIVYWTQGSLFYHRESCLYLLSPAKPYSLAAIKSRAHPCALCAPAELLSEVKSISEQPTPPPPPPAASSAPVTSSSPTYTSPRASYRTYIRGPRGGCYYINGNGNKTYVAHSFCR